ncbi:MAG: bifunctional glycosyltransferase family 2 protein/CDP-glycerol:glycerophosphate glycerophosphotransferase [Candidatus Nanopelagicales bacterium]
MEPLFSIVVPVHNMRPYIGECIASVLTQDMDDFELILIDDTSTDGSTEMIAQIDDPRVVRVFNEENLGLGGSRNVGMQFAHGKYLLFLDADDTFTPGSLRAIRDRIVDTDGPDIVLFDYARSYWNGRQERNVLGRHVTSAAAAGRFHLSDRRNLLDLFNAAWSKAYRRDFIEVNGFAFPSGYYEDLPWTMGTLMAADCIVALDRVVVLYRQRVEGSILRSRSRRHLDVLDQWESVFELLDANPSWEIYRRRLYGFMVSQFDSMLVIHDRIPNDARTEFFDRASAACQRHQPRQWDSKPRGEELLKGTQWRWMALATGNRRLYELLAQGKPPLDSVKHRAREAKKTAKASVSKRVPPAPERGFRTAARKPVDSHVAVFSSYWHRAPACNPLAISQELERRSPEIQQVWVTHEGFRGQVPDNARWVSPASRELGTVLGRASLIVNNVNLPNWMIRRPEQVFLQTQHGTPLKYMGLDMARKPLAKKGFNSWSAFNERVAQWSHCLSSNRYSTLIWEKSMPGFYETLEFGYPRNDVLVTGHEQRVRAMRSKLGIEGRTAVLYAPTMRDYASSIGSLFDLDWWSNRLPSDYVLLVRGHYLEVSQRLPATGNVIDVSDVLPVEDLLLASDVLVTDYSSIMFDFANTGKPIIGYGPDLDTYRTIRGTYFDPAEENPGAFCRTQAEILELITDPVTLDELANGRDYKLFREKFCQFDDGRAAERVTTHLLGLLSQR